MPDAVITQLRKPQKISAIIPFPSRTASAIMIGYEPACLYRDEGRAASAS